MFNADIRPFKLLYFSGVFAATHDRLRVFTWVAEVEAAFLFFDKD